MGKKKKLSDDSSSTFTDMATDSVSDKQLSPPSGYAPATHGNLIDSAISRLEAQGDNQGLIAALSEMRDQHPCFFHAGIEEPLFTLRGQDKLAAKTVRFWEDLAWEKGVPAFKISGAEQIRRAMKEFPGRKVPS